MRKKPATIKEIAQQLKVSVSTVSSALQDHPSIGLRPKTQVQEPAAELNYEPNQAAIFFKQGKSFAPGVVITTLQEEFFTNTINGIKKVAIQHNYNVLISQSDEHADREKQIVETMRRQRVDGLIILVSKNTSNCNHFLQLKEYEIPVVFFDRAPALPGVYSVTCSLKNSTVSLVDLLVKKGHKRIAVINGSGNIQLSLERAEGYNEGLKKNILKGEKELIVRTDLTTSGTEKAIGKLLALKKPPTAVIAFNGYVALNAIRYVRRQQGLKFSKDIFIVSYANLPITYYLDSPPFASVEQYTFQQSEKATKMLLDLINKKILIGLVNLKTWCWKAKWSLRENYKLLKFVK